MLTVRFIHLEDVMFFIILQKGGRIPVPRSASFVFLYFAHVLWFDGYSATKREIFLVGCQGLVGIAISNHGHHQILTWQGLLPSCRVFLEVYLIEHVLRSPNSPRQRDRLRQGTISPIYSFPVFQGHC